MPLPDPIPTILSDHLRQLGLTQTATDLNDLIARATQKRWSPVVLLDTVVRTELDARARQRVERRLRVEILERDRVLVATEDLGRDVAGDDRAEDALVGRNTHPPSLGPGAAACNRSRWGDVQLP